MTTQEAISIFRSDFDNIGLTISNAMAEELVAQGHKATGRLLNSIARETTKLLDGLQTEISHFDYGVIVNKGVTADRIPFGRGSGGNSKFITALMNWVRFKGIAGGLEKNIISCTFAIARKMKKEGSPTRGAYRFSSNGRRLEWTDYVILSQSQYIESEITELSDRFIENLYWAKIEEIANKYIQV